MSGNVEAFTFRKSKAFEILNLKFSSYETKVKVFSSDISDLMMNTNSFVYKLLSKDS